MSTKLKISRYTNSYIIGISVVFFILISTVSYAQIPSHNQVWFDVSGTVKIGDKWRVTPEFGYRTEPSIKLNQAYLRTYLSYRPHKNVKLSAWLAHFNSWRLENIKTMELRTSQFVALTWPRVAGFRFEYRLGLDQRMFYNPGYELSKQVHRSRVRVALYTPNFSLLSGRKKFYANGSFELLRNINQREQVQWIDHDWITFVFGYRVNKSMKVETNLLMINLLDPITHDFNREITVFRLRLKYNFQ